MSVDVVDLREFYASPLGRQARRSLAAAMRRAGGLPDDADTVGFGYPLPVLDLVLTANDRAVVLMPARQGAIRWPRQGANRTALTEDDELPLATGSVQCIVMMHVLENASDPALVLDEVWRVLVPEGRLVLVAPNRRGLWARFEHTPFGNGSPFSRGQLSLLLRKARLTPANWQGCLDFPPIRLRWLLRTYPVVDRIARRVWPIFCGAHLVVATKRLYQGVPSRQRKERRVALPAMAPQSARAGSSRADGNRRDGV
ncbi:MAG: methyltransferase domain-containing protein [Nitratireductor sp.]|nr:methyltransferase domain-containing protein [Nitratireductor sp.]